MSFHAEDWEGRKFDGNLEAGGITDNNIINYQFNRNKLPQETVTISNISIIVSDKYDASNISTLNTNSIVPRNRMLNSPMLAAPMLTANVNY